MSFCGVCGSSEISPVVEKNAVVVNGNSVEVDCHFSECKECGCCYATPKQLLLNKELLSDLLNN